MNKKLYITIFTITALFCTSCIQEYLDESNRHYDTGVVAYRCYESSLNHTAELFSQTKLLDGFIGYLEENTLADKSNELQVWLDAETIFYPRYKPRRVGDIWYMMNQTDTLYVINTQGVRLSDDGSEWLAKRFRDNCTHTLSHNGANKWNVVVDDWQTDDYYGTYEMKIDENFTITLRDSSAFEIVGSNRIVLTEYSSPKRNFILTSTLETPLVFQTKYWNEPYAHLMDGEFSFVITDPVTNESETVDVIIISSDNSERDIYVTYKNDVVGFTSLC